MEDGRFSKVRSDPRFRPLRRKKRKTTKVEDKRFEVAETDPDFNDDATISLRQKPISSVQVTEDETNRGEIQMKKMLALYESENSDETESMEEEKEDDYDWGVGNWAANPDEDISETEPTNRLAIVDIDWSKVSAVDLLAAFRSFLPDKRMVIKVTVYVSQYGQQRLPKEEQEGPSALGIFGSTVDSDDEIDKEILRKYERSKLRYYYAVAECASAEAAECLMSKLDGAEFETSHCSFDLRYVPDGESFDDIPVRDEAEDVPDDFKGSIFECNALQKTNVKLSWDEDDERRTKVVKRRFDQDDLEDQDFAAYLSSDGDSDSDSENERKYAKLMKDLDFDANPRGKSVFKRECESELMTSESDDCLELVQATNQTKKVRKDGRKIWDQFEKRRNEKLKRQRRRGQFRVDSSASDSDSGIVSATEKDFLIEVPDNKEGECKEKASLELIMMDDQMLKEARFGKEPSGLLSKERKPKLSRKQRIRQSIAKKSDRDLQESKFEVDLDDPRFKDLLDLADYAIDPTHPAFKSTPGASQLLSAVRQKKNKT